MDDAAAVRVGKSQSVFPRRLQPCSEKGFVDRLMAIAKQPHCNLRMRIIKTLPAKGALRRKDCLLYTSGTAGHNTLRLLPPAVISPAEIDRFIDALDTILKQKES